MLTHSLSWRSRAAVTTAALALGLSIAPVTANAEPRRIHASNPSGEDAPPSELLTTCPIDGPATFEDSWGWARSGGRSHEGVDMIAARGTPVVAVRDGSAQFKTNGLGGRAVWLTADDGDKFYYAHLDDWNGGSRDVAAGELIGWVGSTGNAQGPHLHFETLPGGSVENPFPHTLVACVTDLSAAPEQQPTPGNRLNDPTVWEWFIPET
jgi:murein DD-endopeptidase MepM/ murein hydrolase activator NlpD